MCSRLGLRLYSDRKATSGFRYRCVHVEIKLGIPTMLWYFCLQILWSAGYIIYFVKEWLGNIRNSEYQGGTCRSYLDQIIWRCVRQISTGIYGQIVCLMDMWITQRMCQETSLSHTSSQLGLRMTRMFWIFVLLHWNLWIRQSCQHIGQCSPPAPKGGMERVLYAYVSKCTWELVKPVYWYALHHI